MKLNSPIIPSSVRSHLALHFGSQSHGSKFYEKSPDSMLERLLHDFPDAFISSQPDPDGRIRIQFTFSEPIGESHVVGIDELTDEERASIVIIERDGTYVRSARSSRVIPTCHCCAIFTSDWKLITMFPGEMAPPLPDSPDIHDDYWDNHVFLEPVVNL